MHKDLKKRNVIVFTNHLLPYSETFIRSQGQFLKKFNAKFVGSYDVESGLELPDNSRYVIRNNFLGSFTDSLLKLGFTLPWLKRKLIQCKPDLIHAHFGPSGITALSISQVLNIPLLTTFHGFDVTISNPSVEEYGRLHKRFWEKKRTLMDKGHAFIAVSKFVRKKMIEQGYPEDKILQHYIGVDTTYFSPQPNCERDLTVLMVGRMVPYKGHEYLIRAMQQVQKASPEVKLKLIGDGPERTRLESLAFSLGVKVEFTGKLPPEKVRSAMRKAKVYCQTSIKLENGHEEALALTIVEAQAVGTPAIVFNSGGMPEAINHGKSGFVVTEKDINELAEKITFLFKEADHWNAFSEESRNFACKCHDLATQCSELEDIYETVLADYKGI